MNRKRRDYTRVEVTRDSNTVNGTLKALSASVNSATKDRLLRRQTAMKRLRYRLHWASGEAPKPSLKWAIYDWTLICPVAYLESRVTGRKVCALLNTWAATQPQDGEL